LGPKERRFVHGMHVLWPTVHEVHVPGLNCLIIASLAHGVHIRRS
jgi:hypothetical protein